MSRCIIIAPLYNGEEREWLTPRAGDLLLCADGGYASAIRHGFRPDVTIGDFDSMPDVAVAGEVVRLPVHKDDTDMVVCLEEGRKRGYREFIAAGCLGGRFDHTLSCLQCAEDCAARGESLWLCDAQNRVTVLHPGAYIIPAIPGRKLSLLAFTPQVTGVTLSGALWPLQQATLTSRYPLGCSNEFTAEAAQLSFREGSLVLCCSADASANGTA
ncbi:MAG: thiamine diphosphokinase [Clostridia bacterium]|nr:thiamine diphosphokinase [Clostridia bacterium]